MTTIAYDKPIADFIAGLDATGHVTHKSYKKKSVTFHHNGGRLSLQGILNVWKTRPASAHFQSDRAGNLGQYVRVNEYAWATGNTTGNIESISIEMANETLAPTWRVNEVTWKSAARLAGWLFANVIKEAPTKSNVFVHKHWKPTDCAGPYIDSIFDQLLAEVQVWYKHFTQTKPTPKPPVPSKPAPRPTDVPGKKSIATIAAEVIAGKWGDGPTRRRRLTAAGYSYAAVQAEVNRKLGSAPTPPTRRKSIQTVAVEVMNGKWGNGDDRRRRLTRAGFDYASVQREVNRRLLG